MYHQRHSSNQPGHRVSPASDEPAADDRALWNETAAALAAVGIDLVQAGDGRPGTVLQPGPRDLAVVVTWQPTEQHPLPGGVLAVNICRTRDAAEPSTRTVTNLILQALLADAGLRTTYIDGHLVVVHPDVQISRTGGQGRYRSCPPSDTRRPGPTAPTAAGRLAAPDRITTRLTRLGAARERVRKFV
ncbi:hypothetical protein ACWEQL_27780 [Kitasatospora sp. NPDC004240]